MNLNKIFLFLTGCLLGLSVPSAGAQQQKEADADAESANVTIFALEKEPIAILTLVKLAPEANIKAEQEKGAIKGYALEWAELTMRITVEDNKDQQVQIDKLQKWMAQFRGKEAEAPAIPALKKFIAESKRRYTVELPQGFDTGGIATGFLLKLSKQLKAYPFTGNSFYDLQGFRMIGYPYDPPFFGWVGRTILPEGKSKAIKDLIKGNWKAETIISQTIDENKWAIEINSSSEFSADGTYISKGVSKMRITASEEQEVIKIRFDMTTRGRWEASDSQVVLSDISIETSSVETNNPDFEEEAKEVAAGFQGMTDTSSNWLIGRSSDALLLQDSETGVIQSLTRTSAAGNPKPEIK